MSKVDLNAILQAEGHDGARQAFDDALANADAEPAPPRAPALRRFALRSAAAFVREYVPLAYAVEPIIRAASLYTLTATTGTGKTGLLVAALLAGVTGRKDILGLEVEKSRVAYLAAENPDDIRMRIATAAYVLNIDLAELGDDLMVLDERIKPEEMVIALGQAGPRGLIAIDTLAAFFDGKDINDNVQAGEYMRRLRPLTKLPGIPAVIVAAHPTKNAAPDQLVPYGGGAILNEVDGNLTMSKKEASGFAELHWQGKIRGLEFEAKPFRFELSGCPHILDAKGRQIHLPVLRPCSAEDVTRREQSESGLDLTLLRAMVASPSGTQAEWGDAIGRSKGGVNKMLNRLKGEKLVDVALGKWSLTTKGKKAMDRAGAS